MLHFAWQDALSIKPLVRWIESRDWDIRYSQLTNRPVTTAWFYKNSGHWLYREKFAVQLDLPLALKNKIKLRHFFVIVRLRIFLNIDDMHCRHRIINVRKRSLTVSTRALHFINLIELSYFVI